jgi:SAM-dependent methyltransferase
MVAMNLAALWHDLECGGYTEDLLSWRSLAATTGGPVLDVGAGTGRVTLDLAAQGHAVVALDTEAALLAALEHRARGLAVATVVADARSFDLQRRFSLVVVPMQTLQLLGGRPGRAAFLGCARRHLKPGGVIAAALADAMDCFDDEHDAPPPPDTLDIARVRYASRLLAVVDDGGRAALRRRREIVGPGRDRHAEDVVLHLDRVPAEEFAAEAAELGFLVGPHRQVRESERYLGSTIVVLRTPH